MTFVARWAGRLAAVLVAGVVALAPLHAHADAALDRLEAIADRAEGLHAVKRLQMAYAQYSEFGMWDEMADLFAPDAELVYGPDTLRGQPAIRAYFKSHFGGGRDGLKPGALHVQMSITPVVAMAADGLSAQGRWHELSMLGGGGDPAGWAGGVQDNDYVRENGVWKIKRLHYYAQFAGPYEGGWRNLDADAAFTPYRFTPADVGRPVPALPAALTPRPGAPAARLAAVEHRLRTLAVEDEARNLQYAYGYYVDRRMWDDVADLFAPGGSLTIAGVGTFKGAKAIRQALERDGPAGLQHGQLNDQVQLGALVTAAPGGRAAYIRGLQLGMTGENNKAAHWSETVFLNRFEKVGGKWRIRAMALYPKMKSDYYQGWGESVLVPPSSAIPAFSFANPVTGRPARYPAGATVVGAAPALPAASAPPGGDMPARIAAAEKSAHAAIAYDAVENLSAAFGWYDDDGFGDAAFWDPFVAIFTPDACRAMPAVGVYCGRGRIRQAEIRSHGAGRPSPRLSITLHMRVQPVIHLSADGHTAKLRTRLFQSGSARNRASGWNGGMYEDTAKLTDDGWLLSTVEIDHVWRAPGYDAGWGKVPEKFGVRRPDKLLTEYPPDRPPKGITFAPFPDIGPMWFHYPNPVSGRIPKDYWPD